MEIKIEDLLLEIAKLKKEIEKLKIENEQLKKENAWLRAQLNMNSSNSSLPPSSDRFGKKKDKNRSLRKKSSKPSGGQKGHKGSTLNKSDNPDFIVDLELHSCPHCNSTLENIDIEEVKTRQVFDIPDIKVLVTEYRSQVKTCPHCKQKSSANFPNNVTHPTQYGANIKALITNLNVYQALPYKRIQEFLEDTFNLHLSEGTIYNTLKKAFYSLEKVEEFFKKELIKSEIAHADETGTKVNGKMQWVHSFSNDKYTLLTSHKNRGKKALEDAGIIPNFNGILTHDCWYAYDSYMHISHALCCAHFLRELQSLEENTELKFPSMIKEFLINLKEKLESGEEISPEEELKIFLKYMELIEEGKREERAYYLTDVLEPKKRKSKAYNLLKRLSRYEDVLKFFLERNASIFTNNAAEREVRNVKIKSKVQGAFRSELGSEIYCRVRSYVATMKKHGHKIYEALKSVFGLSEIMLPIVE